MKFGYREECLDHETGPRHPEQPDRLTAIRRGLSRKHGVEYAEGAPAEESAVREVHDDGYIEAIKGFCEGGGGEWDADTVACEATWAAALASAGLAQWAALEAVDGADGRGTPFSIGRPPGHHAVANDAMGFCFINNVCVAADTAIRERDVDRVAILDWDVHHGNGTQDIFIDREDVFYASLHERGLYPGTGKIAETGQGEADGTNLNAPLAPGSGDPDYQAVVEEVIAPAFVEFDPGLVLVSAGFDAHEHDPISRMRVTTEGYGALTAGMRTVADHVDAGLGFVLEGGYALETLAESVGMVHEVFDGREPAPDEGDPTSETRTVIDDLRAQGFGSK
jgi:acetoin utilization deacetylase AcuC-like enzyme